MYDVEVKKEKCKIRISDNKYDINEAQGGTRSAYVRERILQNPAESCLEYILLFWKSEGQNRQSLESLVDSDHPAVSLSCYGNLISSNSVSTLNNKQSVLAPRHEASDMKKK